VTTILIEAHPLLDVVAFLTHWPAPLGTVQTSPDVASLFRLDAPAPMTRDEGTKPAVRDLLRHGGFSPSGRAKPASEYLVKATESGWLSPTRSINAAVDALNAVSLHSGLPISVVDADLAQAPWRIGICPPGTRYVFNPTGQDINLAGLVCLHDAEGACGGPVKDSQRTKTHEATTRTLTIVWGTHALPGRAQAAARWNRDLLEAMGAQTQALQTEAPQNADAEIGALSP
jgi:DNA/RNA-binding domain of Phe-tRNA-synthetase-like protein